MRDLIFDWESFVNESDGLPPLIRCAMMHYQIEAIHPYLDGNGRIGRLLITLFLCERGVLATPLLDLSAYFDRDRQRYYDELFRMSVTCDWQAWLSYFLEGVAEQAHDALTRIRRVRTIQDKYRQALQERRETANGFRLLDELMANPIMTASSAAKLTGLSVAGARRILDRFADAGIVTLYVGAYPHLYIAQELISEIDPAVT